MASQDLLDILKQIPAVPGYVLTAGQLIRWSYQRYTAWRRKRQPQAVEIIDHRIRIRTEIEERLQTHARRPNAPVTEPPLYEEIIVRDMKRLDEFPQMDLRSTGISSWIKFEVHGLYHRGIEVFLSDVRKAIQIANERGIAEWRLLARSEEERYPDAFHAVPIGRIPFEFIERIDWARDEYYGAPHFYCRYDGPFREPYEEIIYRAVLYPDVSRTHHELHGIHPEHYDWGSVRRWTFLARLEAIRRWQRWWSVVSRDSKRRA